MKRRLSGEMFQQKADPRGRLDGQPSKKKHVVLDARDRIGETKSKKPGITDVEEVVRSQAKQPGQVEKGWATKTRDKSKQESYHLLLCI